MCTFLISQIPTIFYSSSKKVGWYLVNLFSEVQVYEKIGIWMYYWGVSLNFLILAFCINYPNNISKKVSNFILIVTILDVLHLLYNGKQGFGFAKIGVAIIIYYGSIIYNGANKSSI